jgi:phosphatidylglycerol:prolipoprotein diacylglycerol transferase
MPMGMHMGRVRLPAYGMCAAAGLIAAAWLSQRTARLTGVDADRLWDAGVLTICMAFVVSRLLLIARDPRAFLKYPLLVLMLPSLTYGGMALTALLAAGYLRWKRLRLRDVLDAWAPCGALLAAVLSLGHLLEGTDAGMPTRLPWGMVNRGDSALGREQPVQVYAILAALVLLGVLLLLLRRRQRPGSVAAVALVAGGLVSFLLDMLTQPLESAGLAGTGLMVPDWMGHGPGQWLEPGQWIALGAILAGAWLWITARPLPGGRLGGSAGPYADPYREAEGKS